MRYQAGPEDGGEPSSLQRRTMLKLAAAAGAATALPLTRAGDAEAATTATDRFQGATGGGGFVREFAAPGARLRPKFRWWWPDALVDTDEIEREIDQIAAAGFGGVEIAAVTHSVSGQIDPVKSGWGTPAWADAVETAVSGRRSAASSSTSPSAPRGPPLSPASRLTVRGHSRNWLTAWPSSSPAPRTPVRFPSRRPLRPAA
jgi:hypothetical protein